MILLRTLYKFMIFITKEYCYFLILSIESICNLCWPMGSFVICKKIHGAPAEVVFLEQTFLKEIYSLPLWKRFPKILVHRKNSVFKHIVKEKASAWKMLLSMTVSNNKGWLDVFFDSRVLPFFLIVFFKKYRLRQ